MPVVRPDYFRGWQGLASLKGHSAKWNAPALAALTRIGIDLKVPETAMPLATRLAAAAMAIILCSAPDGWTQTAITPPDFSSVQYSCTFENSWAECGFAEQAKVAGRASLVRIARDGTKGVRLHTKPGDSNVAGSGDAERNDLR